MNVTEQDFENLYETSMKWGPDWSDQQHRFECDEEIFYDWSHAYWFDNYANVMWAKKFLIQAKTDWQLIFDTHTEQWMLVTTYPSLVWQR